MTPAHRVLAVSCLALPLTLACSDPDPGSSGVDASPPSDPDAAAGTDAPVAVDPAQTPPSGAAALATWLAAGHYLSWHCEAAGHPARGASAHGRNRICNNALLRAATGARFPVGAASVKELLDANDAIVGYAVARKDAEGTDGGNWYWFERFGSTIYADGAGNSGGARTICVDCHSHATRDFVYTVVP
jgi:hypothetical protein